MKTLIIAGILALSSSAATAQLFEFQKQFGGPENDLYSDTRGMQFAPVTASNLTPSLNRWMYSANVDSIADNDFQGVIVPSGPTRISLYEFVRDSPEGIAYRDYHQRYPVDTDWAQIAREYRPHASEGLAAENAQSRGDS